MIEQEFLLLGETGAFNYTIGAYYLDEESDQDLGFFLGGPLSESTIASTNEAYALFADVGWQITDQLQSEP